MFCPAQKGEVSSVTFAPTGTRLSTDVATIRTDSAVGKTIMKMMKMMIRRPTGSGWSRRCPQIGKRRRRTGLRSVAAGGERVRRTVELEQSLVVATLKRRTVRMVDLQMVEEVLRLVGRMAAVLADVDLGAPLFEGVVQLDAVDLASVRLERTALCEGFVARRTLVRPDT